LLGRLVVDVLERHRHVGRRHAVRLGEHDVEADRDRAHAGEPRDDLGHLRARPRPLAELLEARLVDIEDDDRPLFGGARPRHLEKVEGAQPQLLDRRRVPHTQRHQADQQHQADRAREAETAPPPRQPFHDPAIPELFHFYFSLNARINWSLSGFIR
jgi:hypothetical protein